MTFYCVERLEKNKKQTHFILALNWIETSVSPGFLLDRIIKREDALFTFIING